MFDLFRDINLASHGVDVEAINAARAEERERKRLNTFIFSVKVKIIICVLAALYFAVTIYALLNRSGFSFDSALDVMFIFVALGITVCLWLFGKKGEVTALCGIIGLVVGIYVRAVL